MTTVIVTQDVLLHIPIGYKGVTFVAFKQAAERFLSSQHECSHEETQDRTQDVMLFIHPQLCVLLCGGKRKCRLTDFNKKIKRDKAPQRKKV